MADQEHYAPESEDEYEVYDEYEEYAEGEENDAYPDANENYAEWPPEKSGGLLQSGIVRFTLLAVVVVALLVVGTLAGLYLYRQSRNKPLDVKIYPGAQMITQETVYDGLDHRQFLTDAPFTDVETFYDALDGMQCEPQYTVVQEHDGTTYREGHLSTTCSIDRSGFGISQFATVTIQPVLDEAGNPTEQVMIDITRHWGE